MENSNSYQQKSPIFPFSNSVQVLLVALVMISSFVAGALWFKANPDSTLLGGKVAGTKTEGKTDTAANEAAKPVTGVAKAQEVAAKIGLNKMSLKNVSSRAKQHLP